MDILDLLDSMVVLLEWIALNPIQGLVLLFVEFTIMYTLYYKFKKNKILKVVFGTIFSPQNAVFNLIPMTIIGLDPPRELATTLRLKRWKRREGIDIPIIGDLVWSWRLLFANTLCRMVNKADPGHC